MRGADVRTVIIDGQVVLEGRRVLTIDEYLVRHPAGGEARAAYYLASGVQPRQDPRRSV